jgi:hypothetical protein
MRKLSKERRRIVVLAAVMASTSGTMPMLLRGHSRALWVWIGAEMLILLMVVGLAVRLWRKGDCA